MKHLLLAFCFLAFSTSALAQASATSETFDIATFQPPKGWEKETFQEKVRFYTKDKTSGAYCRIVLLKSLPGPGNSRENFDVAWKTLIKEAGDVAAAPQMFPSNNQENWSLEGGFAPLEILGAKGVVVLYTISGYSKMVNVMIFTNAQTYEPDIKAFVESITLEKPVKN